MGEIAEEPYSELEDAAHPLQRSSRSDSRLGDNLSPMGCDVRKFSAPPWTAEYADAAQRIFEAISKQGVYSSEEAIDVLLKEVNERGDHVTEGELLRRLGPVETIAEADESGEDVDVAVSSRKQSVVAEGRGADEARQRLLAVAQLLGGGVDSAFDRIDVALSNNTVTSGLDSFVDYALKSLQDQWSFLLRSLLPLQQIQTLVVIFVVQLVGTGRLLRTIPLIVCYAAFCAMIFNNLRMFHGRSQIRQLRVWRRLLHTFSRVKSAAHESQLEQSFFSWKSSDPYINFFISTVVFVLSFAWSRKQVPNCLALAGLALFFCLLSFVNLADRFDVLAVWAMALNVFSSLPLICEKLGVDAWAVLQPLAHVDAGWVRLSVGLPSVALAAVPLVYVVMAVRFRQRADLYKVAVPHLVCLCWSEVSLTLFTSERVSANLSNVLVALAVACVLLWPSAGGLAVAAALLLAPLRPYVTVAGAVRTTVLCVTLVLPFVYGKAASFVARCCGVAERPSGARAATRWAPLVLYVALVLVAVSTLYHGRLGFSADTDVSNLTWTAFDKQCSADGSNQIRQQILCSDLKGVAVSWKGSVQSVRLTKIDNSLEALLEYVPRAVAGWLRCFYGTQGFSIAKGAASCNLASHDVYTFELEVSGPFGEHMISSSKGSAVLVGGHVFQRVLERLEEGDVVRFFAYFDKPPVFAYPPRLRLLRLECVTCKSAAAAAKGGGGESEAVAAEAFSGMLWTRFFYSFKFFFNFLFAPLFMIPMQ